MGRTFLFAIPHGVERFPRHDTCQGGVKFEVKRRIRRDFPFTTQVFKFISVTDRRLISVSDPRDYQKENPRDPCPGISGGFDAFKLINDPRDSPGILLFDDISHGTLMMIVTRIVMNPLRLVK